MSDTTMTFEQQSQTDLKMNDSALMEQLNKRVVVHTVDDSEDD